MGKSDRIMFYIASILIVIASFYVKRIDDDEKFILIKGTTNYYHIRTGTIQDTTIVAEKDLSTRALIYIKLGYYD